MIDAPGWNNSQTIDWAKAPEWAGAVVEALCGTKFWVTKFGGVSARQRVGASEPDTEVAKMRGSHGWTLVETRPTESPAWNGEGLPPVGTVCEWRDDDFGDWRKVEVKYMSKHTALLAFDVADDCEGAFSPTNCQFRPIRTPEQTAAEARALEILEIERIAVTGENYGQHYAAAIYDAGYRKVEQP